jgi:Holliday junction resolvase RusA-like endonuclease
MRLVLEGDPISQCRHRTSNGRTYDPRSDVKKSLKWVIAAQIKKLTSKLPKDQPLALELNLHTPIAESLSMVKKRALDGMWDMSAPDVDNYSKFYMDTMNRIAYEDDRFISRLWVEKKKSSTPRAEIIIYSLGGEMINEHALTINHEITAADLEYLVKKANKIGKQGREIVRVYSQEDGEGKHIYFECDALKERHYVD